MATKRDLLICADIVGRRRARPGWRGSGSRVDGSGVAGWLQFGKKRELLDVLENRVMRDEADVEPDCRRCDPPVSFVILILDGTHTDTVCDAVASGKHVVLTRDRMRVRSWNIAGRRGC